MPRRNADSSTWGTVRRALPAKLFVAEYVDQRGVEEVRFVIESSGQFYVLQDHVGATPLTANAPVWLQNDLKKLTAPKEDTQVLPLGDSK